MQKVEAPLGKRSAKALSTRDRILQTATRLFLRDGYSATNLEHVAEEAGVTKPTVYSHFESKRGLFDAVIQKNADRRAQQLKEVLTVTTDPREDLIRFGDLFMERVLCREARGWDRLAAAEAMANPEVGEAFYRAGPARVLRALAGYLTSQAEAGRLRIQHPQRAAEQLLGMLLGLDMLRTQIGQPAPSAGQRKSRCREAIDVFLAAYQE